MIEKYLKFIYFIHLTLPLAKPLIKVAKSGARQKRMIKKIDIRDGEQVEKPVHGTMTRSHQL